MKAKHHPSNEPRGKRDPKSCKVQTGGMLVFIYTLPGIYDRQPMFWSNRPLKFQGHIGMMLRKEGAVCEDVKWKQLGSETWWRIPEWPDGRAESEIGT